MKGWNVLESELVYFLSGCFWGAMIALIIVSYIAMYVDIIHINIPFKNRFNYKLKILAERKTMVTAFEFVNNFKINIATAN